MSKCLGVYLELKEIYECKLIVEMRNYCTNFRNDWGKYRDIGYMYIWIEVCVCVYVWACVCVCVSAFRKNLQMSIIDRVYVKDLCWCPDGKRFSIPFPSGVIDEILIL